MSSSKTTNGPNDTDVQIVSRALREIARETDQVTLAELLRLTSLDSAIVETLIGTLELRNLVPASRIEMPSATIA